ncbi:MAG: segregation/condensation protein A [Planctomycetota bacterium]
MSDRDHSTLIESADHTVGPPARPLTEGEVQQLDAEVNAQVFAPQSDPGLGLLLEMAKTGDYDPWDVDIVALTDRYLAAMDEQLDAQDLGQVGRMIFYAAALIHLKAQALAEREAQREAERLAQQAELADALFDEGFDLLGDGGRLRPDDLPLVYPDFMTEGSREGITLAPRERTPRKRGLTLVDLILALRSYDDRIAEREAALEDEPLFDGDMAFEECVGGAHQDDLDRDLVEVRQQLWEELPEDGHVTLEALVSEQRPRGAAYLALLFLAQDEEVVLKQTDFYGELRVVRGPYFGEVRAGVRFDDDPEDLILDSEEDPEVGFDEDDEDLEDDAADADVEPEEVSGE